MIFFVKVSLYFSLYYDVITRNYRNVPQGIIIFFIGVRSNINVFIKNDYVKFSTYVVLILNAPKGAHLYYYPT